TGTAVAATGAWNPLVGSSDEPATISDTPVPAELTAKLGVLRRDQTAQDRSAEVEATLDGGEALPTGVRLDAVRYLAPAPNGEATILLSGVDTSPIFTEEEPLCVARPFFGDQRAVSLCFGLSMLMSGDARGLLIDASGAATALGIVPDGVATVTAEFGSAPDRTVSVTNNYWELSLGGAELSNANGESGVQATVWRDADGNVVPHQ
ncbi:MAG: hypothetical protein WBL45_01810, partial [Solirubrobacterales bacterium]